MKTLLKLAVVLGAVGAFGHLHVKAHGRVRVEPSLDRAMDVAEAQARRHAGYELSDVDTAIKLPKPKKLPPADFDKLVSAYTLASNPSPAQVKSLAKKGR